MQIYPINTIDQKIIEIRAHLGAKWSVILLLLPLVVFGTYHFGFRALLVVSLSVLSCMVFGIIFRLLRNESYQLIHPGSIITGLLLGLTLQATTPIYMIMTGALFAEYIGKHLLIKKQQTLFNPAILGRTFVGLLELFDPPKTIDVVSSASVLAKEAGGTPPPEFFDVFFGLTQGAIGETSTFLLILLGILLLRYVVLKWEAAISMIITVLLMVVILPPTAEIVGHAPWFQNPLIYLFGGSTLFCAIFFASDPATIPSTRWGCILFGIGAGILGVLGKFYTSIQGIEMYGILIMNLTVPFLDNIFKRTDKSESNVNSSIISLPDSLTKHVTEKSLSETYSTHSFYAAQTDVATKIRLQKPAYPKGIHVPHFENYQTKAFSIFRQILENGIKDDIFEKIKAVGLKGCGGAHFPVFSKWKAFCQSQHPRLLVVNGLEGEPQSFKDCYLLQNHAQIVVEGAAIAAYTTEIEHIYIVINSRYRPALDAIDKAIEKFTQDFGDKVSFKIEIVNGPKPDLYVCGEETALLQYLQSKRAEPQLRPPFPTEKGLWGHPTLIHNVETLSWLPIILTPEWSDPVPKLISLSGALKNVGVYEISPGKISLGEILALGGGNDDLLAFFIGGISGGFLPPACIDLSYNNDSLSKAGVMLGSGAIQILSNSSNIFDEALQISQFLMEESCGRCTPCRVGTREMVRLWENLIQGNEKKNDLSLLLAVSDTMKISSSCGFGMAAPRAILSVLRYWSVGEEK